MPTIGTSDGRLSVRIPVRPGAEPTTVLVDVIAALCGGEAVPSNVPDGSMRLKVLLLRPLALLPCLKVPVSGCLRPITNGIGALLWHG